MGNWRNSGGKVSGCLSCCRLAVRAYGSVTGTVASLAADIRQPFPHHVSHRKGLMHKSVPRVQEQPGGCSYTCSGGIKRVNPRVFP